MKVETEGSKTFVGIDELIFEVGQRFDCKSQWGQIRTLKILAIADKHIMCRFKGCVPFVKSEKEFGRYLESISATLNRNKK